MREIWAVSDTHFSHNKILKYTGRTEFMNEHELKKYEDCNGDRDKIDEMIISDNSTNKMNEIMIKNWNGLVNEGDVVLHLGDFSLGSKRKRSKLRDRLNGTIILILGCHDGSKWRIARDGFIVVDAPIYIDDFIFTHQPMDEVPDGKWNVHGHIHNLTTFGRRINVSVEQIDYKPINLKELEKMIE